MDESSTDPSRRQALKTAMAAGGAAWLGAGHSAGHGSPEAGESSGSVSDWSLVRAEFDLASKAPLNAANLAPAYRNVLAAQANYTQRLSADVSFINRRDFVRNEVAEARQACADMLGVSAQELAFVRNTSEANATVVAGLSLAESDEVLLWDENHSSNYRSWHYQHQRRPFQVRRVSLPSQPESSQDLIQPFLQAITANTAVVSFSHVSNISGMRLPVEQLCQAIKAVREDIYIHIDGAQAFGSLAVDLSQIACDSYAAPTHKWLCGPRGVGLLVVKKQAVKLPAPLQVGYDMEYSYPLNELAATAHRYEGYGQRDTAAIGAVKQAVMQHQQIGMQGIEARVAALTEYTKQAFAASGITTITPQVSSLSHAVVVADVGSKIKAIAAFLALHNAGYAAAFVHGQQAHCDVDSVHGNTDAPTWLRLCPHIYNNEADIDAAVALVKRTTESTVEMLKQAWKFL